MILDKTVLMLSKSRLKAINEYERYPDTIQNEQLRNLLAQAQNTEWGKKYGYAHIKSYEDFASAVPLQDYDDIKPYIVRMLHGESNLIWPEKITWFAQSSGTTNDKSKYIPIGNAALHQCHYRGPKDLIATYLNNTPGSRMFSGKGLILGGSHRPLEYEHNKKVFIGDLSAVLISNMNPLANFFRVPSKKIVLMGEWEKKLELICQYTINQNVTSLSGVPSWFMVLINKILTETKKDSLTEIWPDLEVFFHGGISFTPYREQYKALIPSSQMQYMETYNASEGFFAFQNDLSDPSLLLMLDYGVFYEFMPVEAIDSGNPAVVRLQDVEIDRNYAMIITTNSGLWRYKIGDTVRFTSLKPCKFVITGRTRHYINAFGEELMVGNVEKALSVACMQTSAKIKEYTAAPVYMSGRNKGKHQWLIEFEQVPDSLREFALILDDTLKTLNSDYEAKRYKNMTLDFPDITMARKNLFYDWLKKKGKLGGQNKIPRLSNTREYIDSILSMVDKTV
jgi:hypothetical protein